jgi:hypothetical protein
MIRLRREVLRRLERLLHLLRVFVDAHQAKYPRSGGFQTAIWNSAVCVSAEFPKLNKEDTLALPFGELQTVSPSPARRH